MVGRKIALVTGANRGIGLEIARRLGREMKNDGGYVIMAGRDSSKIKEACLVLQKDGIPSLHMHLDVNSHEDIQTAANEIKDNFGGLDILINNAGVMHKPSYIKETQMSYAEQVRLTLNTNLFSIVNICKIMFPLMNLNSRVVHMSSILAKLSCLSKELRQEMNGIETSDALVQLMTSYLNASKDGSYVDRGWPKQSENDWVPAAYSVSKVAVNALARVQAIEFAIGSRNDVIVSSCCPGWVKTEMGGEKAPLSAADGAITPVFCASLPNDSISGLFYKDCKPMRSPQKRKN